MVTCQSDYQDANGNDTESATIDGTLSRLVSTFQAIQARTSAPVWVLTYPLMLAPTSDTSIPGCAPLISSDQDWLIATQKHLNQVVRTAAATAGVNLLDEEAAFAGHVLCTSQPYVNSLDIQKPTYSFHPNADGYRKEAVDLEARLNL